MLTLCQESMVVTFMAALCDWVDWSNARRAAQVPGAGKEKTQADLTEGAWSCEPVLGAANRDLHGGRLLVTDL